MGRGLVADTSNFMQGANAAGGAAGNSSAQGMGLIGGVSASARQGIGQGTDFMRGGYGMTNSMMGSAGNSWNNVGQLGVQQSNLAMQGYQARQKLFGDIAGAFGTFAGLKFADGGEVDSDEAYDPQTLAEAQVNAVMGYKNGGHVARRPPKVRPGSTTQRGGKVSGPGGPKDDRVPALLSDGEFVMPVGTVRKYGLDKLEKMRQDGLQFEKQLGIGRA